MGIHNDCNNTSMFNPTPSAFTFTLNCEVENARSSYTPSPAGTFQTSTFELNCKVEQAVVSDDGQYDMNTTFNDWVSVIYTQNTQVTHSDLVVPRH